ncbi:hypothetical protein TNCV_1987361 [Trichonephila clavipes]|nr:hypothetical protein TNCV_1987361 [Trichonephila clavipes]
MFVGKFCANKKDSYPLPFPQFLRWPSGHSHELVAGELGVRLLVLVKSGVFGADHVKCFEVPSPHFGIVGKFGEWGVSSVVLFVM